MLCPNSFQKNHSLSYIVKMVKQEMALFLRGLLLPSYCMYGDFEPLGYFLSECLRDNEVNGIMIRQAQKGISRVRLEMTNKRAKTC